jgi:hypothetical protein
VAQSTEEWLGIMSTQVRAHPLILTGKHWVGFARRRKNSALELYPSIEYVGSRLRQTNWKKLLDTDATLAELKRFPPMTQAWRWEPGSEFSWGRLPAGRTFFFWGEGRPGPDHPERERIGAAVLNIWVRAESKAKAQALFEQEVSDLALVLDQSEGPRACRLEDYENDPERRERFEQAQIDGLVVVCHVCPKYPVYWVTAIARRISRGKTATLHYFLSADSICRDVDDVFDPDFWTGKHERKAVKAAVGAIREVGWTVTAVTEQRPCGREDVPEELTGGYDEAEEAGACLVVS